MKSESLSVYLNEEEDPQLAFPDTSSPGERSETKLRMQKGKIYIKPWLFYYNLFPDLRQTRPTCVFLWVLYAFLL